MEGTLKALDSHTGGHGFDPYLVFNTSLIGQGVFPEFVPLGPDVLSIPGNAAEVILIAWPGTAVSMLIRLLPGK